jgi:hypothetical protein
MPCSCDEAAHWKARALKAEALLARAKVKFAGILGRVDGALELVPEPAAEASDG